MRCGWQLERIWVAVGRQCQRTGSAGGLESGELFLVEDHIERGDAEAETERKRQEERSRRRCGGKNRSRGLASSDDLQNEPRRQRAATMAGPLSASLSRERLTGSTRSAEELHATAESCRFFAPPPIGSLPRRRLLLRRVLRCVRWAPILTPRFSLGHASRPSEFSPNFLSWALQLKAHRASDQPGALSWEEGRRDPETQRTPCTFSLLASVFLEALSCPMVSGRMNATSQTSLWLLQLSGDRFRKLKTARHPPSMSHRHHNERAAGRTPQLEEPQPRIGIKQAASLTIDEFFVPTRTTSDLPFLQKL